MKEVIAMQKISQKDSMRLQALAEKQREYAESTQNAKILEKWNALGNGQRETPTVRLLFSNFSHEVILPRLQCEGETARRIEWDLLSTMTGIELFHDDTPISPTFDIALHTWATPFGIQGKTTRASGNHAQGFHIDPVITNLEAELDKLQGGNFGVDKESTKQYMDLVSETIGHILPVRIIMNNLTGMMTNPIVHLMGMENFYCAMYDCPDAVHKAMDIACTIYEQFYDFLEQEKLLLPTYGTCPISQESFAFNHELPSDRVSKTTECWGFLESQEMTAVSPETFGEFVFPYQDRLVKRFGLLSYGCCERVDAIFENYLSKWKNLRKLSVSPFNNEKQVGDYLRGTDIVYYSKPRAEYVTLPGPLDEDAVRECFRQIAEAASGCLLEVAQREVGTIFGDFQRGQRYVQLAKESLEEYWKP